MISVGSLERVSAESTWIKHMIQDLCYTLDNHTTFICSFLQNKADLITNYSIDWYNKNRVPTGKIVDP